MMESWVVQKELHQEIKEYKDEINLQNHENTTKYDLDIHDTYIEFLEEVNKAVSKLRSTIIEKKH